MTQSVSLLRRVCNQSCLTSDVTIDGRGTVPVLTLRGPLPPASHHCTGGRPLAAATSPLQLRAQLRQLVRHRQPAVQVLGGHGT